MFSVFISRKLIQTIIFISVCISLVSFTRLAAADGEKSLNDNEQTQIRLKFAHSISADSANDSVEAITIDIRNTPHLIFHRRAVSRKLRGNLLLLPDYHELPLQDQLTLPLAIQLSRLGWDVFTPQIAINDMPIGDSIKMNQQDQKLSPNEKVGQQEKPSNVSNPDNTNSSDNTSSQDSAQSDSKLKTLAGSQSIIFDTSEAYQDYYCQLINQVISSTSLNSKPFVLVSHGNSGYWLLSCLAGISNVKYLVMLDPVLDPRGKSSLKNLFSAQSLPLFLFSTSQQPKSAFTIAVEKQFWGGRKVRLNQGLISKHRLELEDPRIARLITGWVESEAKPK